MKMSSSAVAFLLCSITLSLGSALRCYRCHGYSPVNCQSIQECSYEDSCLSLSEKGGKTIRQCIRYTDCDNLRLTQMFPSVDGFTYRCCSSSLCNSGTLATRSRPALLLGALVLFWWWIL
ncbi:CD59 glycoprotein [Clupea harengus]|uniref:CD59 glycoprotein n=1 Tax=Clupea harengus TaxID=7950 RepID=A0A6P8F9Z0_CLUHA|nr:CD59 glycoprotein [Clupea harengus]